MRKINDVLRRITATVLSVALLLAMCFPVPYMNYHDRLRIERAYANPAVLAGGVGAYVVGTLLVYCGLYIAGNTSEAYNANLDEVYDAYCDYLIDNLEVSQNDIDTIMAQAYDPNQNTINFDTLAAAGFIGAVPAFAQYLINGGQATTGLNNLPTITYKVINGNAYPCTDTIPSVIAQSNNYATVTSSYPYLVGIYDQGTYTDKGNGVLTRTIRAYYSTRDSVTFNSVSGSNPPAVRTSSNIAQMNLSVNEQGAIVSDTKSYNQSFNITTAGNGYRIYVGTGSATANVGTNVSNEAVVNTDILNTRVNELLQTAGTVVQGFEPTAEQLESGYTFEDVVTAGIDEVNVNLGTISTGIAALDTVLNSILGVVSGIATNVLNIWNMLSGLAQAPFSWLASWWQSLTGWWTELLQWIRATPLGTFCANVTSWLGATPIGTLIGGIVSAIPGVGTIEQTLGGILSGVLDIPDAISGVLDGTLSIPDAIADVLSDVFGLDFAGTLQGVLEGVFFPNITLPTLSVNPTYADAVTFEGVLQDKAPFAYMFAFKNAVDGAAETYSNNASFRIRHYFDLAGEDVLFDINAEPYLNRDVGGVTIAQLLRASVTLTLCMGLLYAAYKTGIAAVGSREG